MKKIKIVLLVASLLILSIGCDQKIAGGTTKAPKVTAELVSVDQYMVQPYSDAYNGEYATLSAGYYNDLTDYGRQYSVGLINGSTYLARCNARVQTFTNDKDTLNGIYLNRNEVWGPLEITVRITAEESTGYRLKAVVEYHDGTQKIAYSEALFSTPGTFNKNTQIPVEKCTANTPILSLSVEGI